MSSVVVEYKFTDEATVMSSGAISASILKYVNSVMVSVVGTVMWNAGWWYVNRRAILAETGSLLEDLASAIMGAIPGIDEASAQRLAVQFMRYT